MGWSITLIEVEHERMEKKNDIVCLSYLKWETTLFQRPQQIMTGMAERGHRVLYVSYVSTREFLRRICRGDLSVFTGKPHENLRYINLPYLPLTKYIPPLQWLMNAMMMLATRVAMMLRRMRGAHLWLYHPGLSPFVRLIPHERLVYDCMDQFEAFEKAREWDKSREGRLLKAADIVFTGGRSLQQAKEGVNPRTHCFPSGVEFAHFHKARAPKTEIPADISRIKSPILGYFGAVDERIDFDLIRFLCQTRPDWNVVFLGPLIHFDMSPVQEENFHYLGAKNYADLPGYLKAFDVCLMPFVDSDLTRHISPTKTPEYLAGGKPVVSTPVPDVVADYGDIVRIARDHEAFRDAVADALQDNAAVRTKMEVRARGQAWDQIVAEMDALIEKL